MELSPKGEVITECSVETTDRTKVADVAWASDHFIKEHGMSTPFLKAPEICVEILSPSNTREEMIIKQQLYFEAGAKEVWECDQDGVMSFYTPTDTLDESAIVPTFPTRM